MYNINLHLGVKVNGTIKNLEMIWTLHEIDVPATDQYMKRQSILYAVMDTFKTTKRQHNTPIKLAKIQKSDSTKYQHEIRNQTSPSFLL